MELSYFVRGLAVGFAIAAPVGPIGILVIRRTLADGRMVGLVSGLGAATADAFYGGIAAFGLTALSTVLVDAGSVIRLIGGAFLLYLGLTIVLSRPAEEAASPRPRGLLSAYATTAFLTLTNPATILSFTGVFAGLGLADTHGSYASATAMVFGVLMGSSCWWLLLSSVLGLGRQRMGVRGMRWVNRIGGSVLVVFGATAIVSAIAPLRRGVG